MPASASLSVAHVTVVHKPTDVRIFYKECRTLAGAGYEVHLLAPGGEEPARDGVRLHELPAVDGAQYAWRAWRHLPDVYRRARRVRASVYHLHDPHLVPLGLLLKARGARVVYDAHEDSPVQARSIYAGRPLVALAHSAAWWVLERLAGRLFDAIVCATPTIAARYPPAKTALVRNFPLASEFLSPSFDGARPARGVAGDVVYAGNITTIRGAREMVAAIGLVPERLTPRLVLMGDFSAVEPDLRRDVEALPGWQRVEFLGYRSREDVLDRLARSRAGLVCLHPRPNYREALPVKLFEYMAAGIPVVASDFPLWRRIVEGAGCGLLVDPLDPRAIAEAITFLLEHREEAEEMGRRGRAAFLSGSSWEADAGRLLERYRRVLAG